MAEHFGVQTAQGHLTVPAESKEPYVADVLAQLHADALQVIARYPERRSALLPLLHLVQSVDGYVAGRGIDFCAEVLELETAEVSGVATFYTQYKRHPNGEYTVGVCINTLCAIMGGDRIWDDVSEHLGIGHDETTADGKVTLERIECNAACDYAPVVMTNWEFFDNQTPESTRQLVDDLCAGKPVRPTRGPDTVRTFKQVSRVLAGFHDGLADQGVGAGPASVVGLALAQANDWTAPNGRSGKPDATSSGSANDKPSGSTTDKPSGSATDKPSGSAGEGAVPHDTAAAPPVERSEQSPHEAADGDKPVEPTEKPEATSKPASDADGNVPVEGLPAVVAEADTGMVDKPAAFQALVAGDPPPPAVVSAAVDAPTTPQATVAAQSVHTSPTPLPGFAQPAQDSPGMTVPADTTDPADTTAGAADEADEADGATLPRKTLPAGPPRSASDAPKDSAPTQRERTTNSGTDGKDEG